MATVVGTWRYVKTRQHRKERENPEYAFANAVRRHLKLSNVDNFQSTTGTEYINAITVLQSKLAEKGLYQDNMYNDDLDELAIRTAKAIENTLTVKSTLFGYRTKISPAAIQDNARQIANEAIYQTADKASNCRRSEIEMNPILAANDANGAEIEMKRVSVGIANV